MESPYSAYSPFPWIFWIRIVQLVLTILVGALAAYAASQAGVAGVFGFSFWTLVWSLGYVPFATWFLPKVSPNNRPNIIVLVLEPFTWFWWLVTFAWLAAFSAAMTVFDTNYGVTIDGYITYSADLGYPSGAVACAKAACAFAAINCVLFSVTVIAIAIRIHSQRRLRRAQQQPGPAHVPNMDGNQMPPPPTHQMPPQAYQMPNQTNYPSHQFDDKAAGQVYQQPIQHV